MVLQSPVLRDSGTESFRYLEAKKLRRVWGLGDLGVWGFGIESLGV